MASASVGQAAEIDFSSTTDFIRMELLLKDDKQPHADNFILSVTLSSEATERVQQVSREALGKKLTVSINHRPISTSTVHSVVGSQFKIAIPKPIAKELLRSLVE